MNFKILIFFMILAAPMNVFLWRRVLAGGSREPWREIVVRFGAANFLLGYLIFRVLSFWDVAVRYPDDVTIMSWLNFILVMLTFFFFWVTYLIRQSAMVYANRLREFVIPAICAVLPLVVYELTNWRAYPFLHHETLRPFFEMFWPVPMWHWSSWSIWVISVGNVIAFAGLFYLRHSFSVFTEVRALVTSGPYQFIRHPIYLGQSLSVIGICIHSPSPAKILFGLIFVLLQRYRAHMEEVKIAASLLGYTDYQEKTGVYFPPWRK